MSTTSTARRVAIVTGAAQGIGRAIAQRLAKDGLDLGLFDLPSSQEPLEEVARGIREEYGTRVITLYGSVAVEEDVKGLVDSVVRELGDLYAMIANAGAAGVAGPLHEMATQDLDRMMNVNIKGVFFSYKYAAIRMIEQGKGGRIVGATSVLGKKGTTDHSIYCTTKFAVRGLTQSAAMDYGKYGITVNAYAPGATDTQLWWKQDDIITAREGLPKGSWGSAVGKRSALGRLGQPEDIAKLVSFLVSDDSAFITGQSYTVDGGIQFD